jgi:hypothetical protein
MKKLVMLCSVIYSVYAPPKGVVTQAAPQFPTMDRFFNARETSSNFPLFRHSIGKLLCLCNSLDKISKGKNSSKYEQSILNEMNREIRNITGFDFWTKIELSSYQTGFTKWWTEAIFEVSKKQLEKVYGLDLSKINADDNTKPFILLYTEKTNPPTVLIGFPGMQLNKLADILTVTKFFKKSIGETDKDLGGINAACGFVDAANSVFDTSKGQLMNKIQAAISSTDLSKVQIVFCGHSMGGAVASLCAYKYKRELKQGAANQVLVLTCGQPKTIASASKKAFNDVIPNDTYLRFVNYADNKADEIHKGIEMCDCVSEYRDYSKKETGEDLVGYDHVGAFVRLKTGVILQNTTFFGKVFKWFSKREWLGFMERKYLHEISLYARSILKHPYSQRGCNQYRIQLIQNLAPVNTSPVVQNMTKTTPVTVNRADARALTSALDGFNTKINQMEAKFDQQVQILSSEQKKIALDMKNDIEQQDLVREMHIVVIGEMQERINELENRCLLHEQVINEVVQKRIDELENRLLSLEGIVVVPERIEELENRTIKIHHIQSLMPIVFGCFGGAIVTKFMLNLASGKLNNSQGAKFVVNNLTTCANCLTAYLIFRKLCSFFKNDSRGLVEEVNSFTSNLILK